MLDQYPVLKLWGRSRECDLLDRLVADVREGRSRVWVLRGEAGIGKTALLDYLAGTASGCQVVRTAGIESEMELAYAGLHQFCSSMLGGVNHLPAPHRDALSVAFGLQAGPAPDQFMVGLAVLGLLTQAAEAQPRVCLIDDAQWLDQVSAQTLAFVARRLLAERVALIFAVRDDGDGRVFSGLPELTVRGLLDGDALALLDAVLQGPVDDRVAERLVAETRGNPLALIELPRGLAPEQLAGGFGLPDSMPLASGIEQNFLKRLASLGPDARKLLLAAAADPVGDVTVFWSAAARLGLGMEAADEAESAGLIEIRSRVVFRHPLVRSAAYRAASAGDRRVIHRALAEVTDIVLDPDRRAWHRAQAAAGPDEVVAAELEASADRARARGGAAAAAAFLERAATLTADPSRRAERGLAAASAKRDAGALNAAMALLVSVEHGPPDKWRAAEVSRLRGQLALDLQRGADATRFLLSAARALEALDIGLARQIHLEALGAAMWSDGLDTSTDLLLEAARAALAAPPGPHPPRPVDLVLDALALRFTEGFTAAAPALTRALAGLRNQSLNEAEGRWLWTPGNNIGGIIALELFDSEARYAVGVRQVEAARDTGALVQLQVGLHYLAHTNLPAGELTVATSQIEESCSISAATGNPPVGYTELALAAFRGRPHVALELIENTVRAATTNGQGRIVSFATYASAVLYNGIGRYEAAREAARRVIERNVIGYGPLVIGELAEAASRTGDIGLLQQALEWMQERTAATPNDWSTGIEARIQALISQGEDADRLYRESISRLARTRLRVELARGHLLYGEWLRRERRRVDARTQLGVAHDMLTVMGLEGFARRAGRELLATGATVRKRSISTSQELTAQEDHIARLASEGLSNSEIASQLFLSSRTIEYHLSKAFTKLGISSRVQLRAALTRGNENSEPA
jgi:DNA-binding CsgD family transcriptional regulator